MPKEKDALKKEIKEEKKSGGKFELMTSFFELNTILICGFISIIPIICAILVTKYYEIQTKDFEIIENKAEQGIELTPEEQAFQIRYSNFKKTKEGEKKKNGFNFRPRPKNK